MRFRFIEDCRAEYPVKSSGTQKFFNSPLK